NPGAGRIHHAQAKAGRPLHESTASGPGHERSPERRPPSRADHVGPEGVSISTGHPGSTRGRWRPTEVHLPRTRTEPQGRAPDAADSAARRLLATRRTFFGCAVRPSPWPDLASIAWTFWSSAMELPPVPFGPYFLVPFPPAAQVILAA